MFSMSEQGTQTKINDLKKTNHNDLKTATNVSDLMYCIIRQGVTEEEHPYIFHPSLDL